MERWLFAVAERYAFLIHQFRDGNPSYDDERRFRIERTFCYRDNLAAERDKGGRVCGEWRGEQKKADRENKKSFQHTHTNDSTPDALLASGRYTPTLMLVLWVWRARLALFKQHRPAYELTLVRTPQEDAMPTLVWGYTERTCTTETVSGFS